MTVGGSKSALHFFPASGSLKNVPTCTPPAKGAAKSPRLGVVAWLERRLHFRRWVPGELLSHHRRRHPPMHRLLSVALASLACLWPLPQSWPHHMVLAASAAAPTSPSPPLPRTHLHRRRLRRWAVWGGPLCPQAVPTCPYESPAWSQPPADAPVVYRCFIWWSTMPPPALDAATPLSPRTATTAPISPPQHLAHTSHDSWTSWGLLRADAGVAGRCRSRRRRRRNLRMLTPPLNSVITFN